MSGAIDVAALQAAMDRIVARHENLRTVFVKSGESARLEIRGEGVGLPLTHHDLSSIEADQHQAQVEAIGAEEASKPFDLANGPLIRGRLLKLAEREHVLLVTQHHIVSDGWSIGVLIGEFSELYSAFHQGRPDPLPPLPIQYADYAAWQRQWLHGDELSKRIEFWRNHLQGAPALLELPSDRPRPPSQSYLGDRVPVRLPDALTEALRSFSQRHSATMYMTLLTGWSALLSRLSGQADLVVGSPVANRQPSQVEALVGCFVNTLALRIRLE
ncbi:condensation domain-containing protein, partial [Lysobacter sp. 2RAB21]